MENPPIAETEPPRPQRGATAEERAGEPPPAQRGRTAEERASEPAQPQRGQTSDEMASDASGPERDFEQATSGPKKVWILLKPSFLFSQASGYPVGIKQFLWLCFVLIYPAWLFGVLFLLPVGWLAGKVVYGFFWVLFWPVRKIWGDPNYGKDADDAAKSE